MKLLAKHLQWWRSLLIALRILGVFMIIEEKFSASPSILFFVLLFAAQLAFSGELTTKKIPGSVFGEIEYVQGKYGKAALLKGKFVEGKTQIGIEYPCNSDTFAPREGTFACWVKASNYGCVCLFRTENDKYQLNIWHNKRKNREGVEEFYYFPYACVGEGRYMPMSEMWPDFWYHVVMTWDLKDPNKRGILRTYVNGRATSPRPLLLSATLNLETGKTISIGRFPCLLDEVLILDKALSEEEVNILFFGGSFSPDKNTKLYISFDDASCYGISVTAKPEK